MTNIRSAGMSDTLNGAHHRAALTAFMVIVIAHWGEHLAQAGQIWALGWPRPEARGLLGVPFPWLISSEWLHYGFAIVMLAGLWFLRRGFVGRAYVWWMVAFWLQFWHHIEHLLLLLQAQTGRFIGDGGVPMSIVQLVIPRVELHLFYNTVVFVPMVVAVYLHMRPNRAEEERMTCSCRPARTTAPEQSPAGTAVS
jgi:hypothetical protein